MSDREIRLHTLANGLQLVGEVNNQAKSCGLGFFVRSGARDEQANESGVSHFLEHMMFKGTAKRDAIKISFELGDIGAQANAYTSDETTVYYASIIPEYFGQLQDLLSDMLRPSLDPTEYDMEKKVILEEIALYQDRPFMFLYERAIRDYFGNHPCGNSVLGTAETIGALPRDQMKTYFDRRYAPNNMALVAAGCFEWDRFVADAEKYCGAWQRMETPRAVSRYGARARKEIYQKKNLQQGQLLFFSEAPAAQDQERFAAGVLSVIVGDGSGSKLYWELVDKGIAESASLDTDEKDGAGILIAHASAEVDRLDEVAGLMRAVFQSAGEFSDEDLQRAKTKLLTRVVLSGELPIGRLMALGNSWTYNREAPTLQEIAARIRAVDRQAVEQLLGRYPAQEWAEYRLIPE